MELIRYFVKHVARPDVYAVEGDEQGQILAVLDVTNEATKGGLCPHLLSTLPLAGRIEDVDLVMRQREQFEDYTPECGNVHHLMTDLLALERDHITAAGKFAASDSETKTLKKDMEAKGAKVHALLAQINDYKPLPLFETAGV
jgi:hypothetical protein